ncbi:MAG: hypothetical protein OES13_08725 [Acidimicrobiia bacterium]|nr:hypothetical protein [Acidimicrobiia bacterium]
MDLVAVGAILFGLLLFVVAGLVWQEMKNAPDSHPVYVIEEAVPFVMERLSDRALSSLDGDDVLRILEWEVFYLQGLDEPRDHSAHPAPVAGSVEAIDFIAERSTVAYARADISEVLEGEAAYLVSIGAVGPVVEQESA